MFEKALIGSKRYYAWLLILLAVIGVGFLCYLIQYTVGLGVTGMSRDVSWGFYIGQLTFLVGVAASGLMIVLPYYLHHHKQFAKLTILGEFLAIAALIMCMTFVVVDLGQPSRMLNLVLHPTPNSILFWDFTVLSVYLGLNVIIGFTVLMSEYKQEEPPYYWLKPMIYFSIAWAPLIHTVTAFLYAGLPGRHLWLTAVMAVRFLSSAFAAGPALLIILYLIVVKTNKWSVGDKPLRKIAEIVTYAMILNMFMLGLEFFTAFYSDIPGHKHSLLYLFGAIEGHTFMAPFMWASVLIGLGSILMLVFPGVRHNNKLLVIACAGVFIGCWLEKGLGLIVGGFIPNPLDQITEYVPTLPELGISAGVFAIGALIITVLYKMVVEVREGVES